MSDDEVRIIFKQKLNAYMDAKHITPKDICDALNVSRGVVSQWRQGLKIPRIDKIEKLARLFGCSRSDLLEEKKPPTTGDYSFLDDLTPEEKDQVRQYAAFVKSQRNP